VGAKLHGASEDKPATPEILKQEVAKQGLPADQINVAVSGNTVTVTGKAASIRRRSPSRSAIASEFPRLPIASRWRSHPPRRCTSLQKGDNLSKIAEAQYGKAKANEYQRVSSHLRCQQADAEEPDVIYPGQVLRIPTLV
jgi:LysM domain